MVKSRIEKIKMVVPKSQRKLRRAALDYHEGGYSWEVAVVAAMNEIWINKLDNRIRRLEGKKMLKQSPFKRRSPGDVVSLTKFSGGNHG